MVSVVGKSTTWTRWELGGAVLDGEHEYWQFVRLPLMAAPTIDFSITVSGVVDGWASAPLPLSEATYSTSLSVGRPRRQPSNTVHLEQLKTYPFHLSGAQLLTDELCSAAGRPEDVLRWARRADVAQVVSCQNVVGAVDDLVQAVWRRGTAPQLFEILLADQHIGAHHDTLCRIRTENIAPELERLPPMAGGVTQPD